MGESQESLGVKRSEGSALDGCRAVRYQCFGSLSEAPQRHIHKALVGEFTFYSDTNIIFLMSIHVIEMDENKTCFKEEGDVL